MSKTVHPFGFRLGIMPGYTWKSRVFSVSKFKHYLKADVLIREWLEKKFRGMYVEDIEFERTANLFHIIIKTARPGLLIGRKGEGVEVLKKDIEKKLAKIGSEKSREIRLTIEEVRSPETSAKLVGQMVIEGLAKRMPFRKILKQTTEKVMANRDVKGVKILLSGRLGGADMSRKEWLRKGRIPLQTLRSDISFAKERANLPYGVIGIKVWIYKGERFAEDANVDEKK